jgi:hypothetical protein
VLASSDDILVLPPVSDTRSVLKSYVCVYITGIERHETVSEVYLHSMLSSLGMMKSCGQSSQALEHEHSLPSS